MKNKNCGEKRTMKYIYIFFMFMNFLSIVIVMNKTQNRECGKELMDLLNSSGWSMKKKIKEICDITDCTE